MGCVVFLGCQSSTETTTSDVQVAHDAGASVDYDSQDMSLNDSQIEVDATIPSLELPNWTLKRQLASTSSTNANIQPALAYDKEQNLWLVYAVLSASTNQILLQKYDQSGALDGAPIEIIRDAVGIHNEPAICPLTDGGIVLVWSVDTRREDTANLEVRFQIINEDGQFVNPTPTTIDTSVDGNHWLGSVSCNDANQFMVVGSRSEPNNTFGVFAQVFDNTGQAVDDAHTINASEMGGQVYPVATYVSSADVNGYLVVYEDQQFPESGQVNRLKARLTTPNGVAMGEEFFVSAEGVSTTQPAISSAPGMPISLVAAAIDNERIGLFYVDPRDASSRYTSGSPGPQHVQASVVRHPEADIFLYLDGVGTGAELHLGQHAADTRLAMPISVFDGNLPPYQTALALAEGRAAAAVTQRIDSQNYVIRVIGFGYSE